MRHKRTSKAEEKGFISDGFVIKQEKRILIILCAKNPIKEGFSQHSICWNLLSIRGLQVGVMLGSGCGGLEGFICVKPLTDHFIGRWYLLDDETMIQSMFLIWVLTLRPERLARLPWNGEW